MISDGRMYQCKYLVWVATSRVRECSWYPWLHSPSSEAMRKRHFKTGSATVSNIFPLTVPWCLVATARALAGEKGWKRLKWRVRSGVKMGERWERDGKGRSDVVLEDCRLNIIWVYVPVAAVCRLCTMLSNVFNNSSTSPEPGLGPGLGPAVGLGWWWIDSITYHDGHRKRKCLYWLRQISWSGKLREMVLNQTNMWERKY